MAIVVALASVLGACGSDGGSESAAAISTTTIATTTTSIPATTTTVPVRREYSLTECVYSSGQPDVTHSEGGDVVHYRNFAYIGILAHDNGDTGVNQGIVEIDLNRKTGAGSISGTLSIRDDLMGDFDGSFTGEYTGGLWQGRGSARGVEASSGHSLEVDLQAFPPGECVVHEQMGAAVDGAYWWVAITEG
jgi:hypothetical protein